MTEEHKNLSVEERWMEWAQQTITIQKKELRELLRFKKYSAALEKEVKTLREALELIKKNGKEYPFDGSGCAYVSERALDGADCVAEWQEITEKLISEEKEMNAFWKGGEEC